MSILDTVIISIGVIAVATYLTLSILKNNKWKKIYNNYRQKGYTHQQAKNQADKDIKQKKGKKQPPDHDEMFIEE